MTPAFAFTVAAAALLLALGGGAAPASPLVHLAQAKPAVARAIAGFRKAHVIVYDRHGGHRGSVAAGDLQPLVGATVVRSSQGHFGLTLPAGDYYFSLSDLSLSGATGKTAHAICAEVRSNKAKSGSSGLGVVC